MSSLFDSSVMIDALRRRPEAVAALKDAAMLGKINASEISRFEVLSGMRPSETRATHEFLAAFTWHPADEAVSERAAEFARSYRASHSGIDAADCLIAATADLLGARLITRNVKHFPMFEGLAAPY